MLSNDTAPLRLMLHSPRILITTGTEAPTLAELDARGAELSGDYDWGLPRTDSSDRVKSALDRPAVRSLLRAGVALRYRVLVDPSGQVRDVRAQSDLPTEVAGVIEAILRTMELAPTLRRADGAPAWVGLLLNVVLQPPPVAPTYRELVATGELRVADLHLRSISGAEPGSWWGRPPYLLVTREAEPPSSMDAVEDGIFAVVLDLGPDGRVQAARAVSFLPAEAPFPRHGVELPAPIAGWLEELELEAPPGFALERPEELGAVVDVEVRGGRPSLLTRSAIEASEVKDRIRDCYRLSPGHTLALLAPPHPEERLLLYRFGAPVQARAIPQGPGSIHLQVGGDDDHPSYAGALFGGTTLRWILGVIGFDAHLVRADPELLERPLEVDVVTRAGAAPGDLVLELESMLRERFALDLDLELRSEPVDTVVLRGSLGAKAQTTDPEGRPVLDLYTDVRNPGPEGPSALGLGAQTIVLALASALDMPVVDETVGAAGEIRVRAHRSAMGTANVEAVLRNLEAQTELEITVEHRPADVLVATARQ